MSLILMELKKLVSIYFILFFISCSNNSKPTVYSNSGRALGTTFKILYTSNSPLENIDFLTDSIFFHINRSLSTYMKSSDISKINAGEQFVKVDSHFRNVFNKSKIIWESTNGFFDPTIGLLVKEYGLGPETNKKSSINIDSLLNLTGFEKVSLKNGLVVKHHKGIYLDFNAIAKGYCVDVISKMLKNNNINNHLIDIGGEMVASGKNEVSNLPWKVGLTDPLNYESNSFIYKIQLKNLALASSGNYRKFTIDEKSGEKIVHTINPTNGNAFATNILATSVVAEDCITADAYATSFMAMPLEKSIELISKLKNIDGMIIYFDKKKNVQVFTTKGFDKLILN